MKTDMPRKVFIALQVLLAMILLKMHLKLWVEPFAIGSFGSQIAIALPVLGAYLATLKWFKISGDELFKAPWVIALVVLSTFYLIYLVQFLELPMPMRGLDPESQRAYILEHYRYDVDDFIVRLDGRIIKVYVLQHLRMAKAVTAAGILILTLCIRATVLHRRKRGK